MEEEQGSKGRRARGRERGGVWVRAGSRPSGQLPGSNFSLPLRNRFPGPAGPGELAGASPVLVDLTPEVDFGFSSVDEFPSGCSSKGFVDVVC